MKKRIAQATVVVIATILIICLEIISNPWRYVSVNYRNYFNCNLHKYANQEDFLAKMEMLDEEYNTTIYSRNSNLMLNLAKKYDYNEYLIPALMCLETCGGNRTFGNFNYWNIKQATIIAKGEQLRLIVDFGDFNTEKEAFDALDHVFYINHPNKETYVTFSEKWRSITIKRQFLKDSDSFDVKLYKMVKHIKRL